MGHFASGFPRNPVLHSGRWREVCFSGHRLLLITPKLDPFCLMASELSLSYLFPTFASLFVRLFAQQYLVSLSGF